MTDPERTNTHYANNASCGTMTLQQSGTLHVSNLSARPSVTYVPQQHGGTLVVEADGSQHVEYESGDSSVPTDNGGNVWTRQPSGTLIAHELDPSEYESGA